LTKHIFTLSGDWKGGLNGAGAISVGALQAEIATPVELGGTGQGTNPEEMLLGAAATCYMITLGAILAKRAYPIRALAIRSEATYSSEGGLTCESIVHRPTIELEAGASESQRDEAIKAAHRAEKACMVTKALTGNVVISVEPTVNISQP